MPAAKKPLATLVNFLEKNRCDKALALAKTHTGELNALLTNKQVSAFIKDPQQATSDAEKKLGLNNYKPSSNARG